MRKSSYYTSEAHETYSNEYYQRPPTPASFYPSINVVVPETTQSIFIQPNVHRPSLVQNRNTSRRYEVREKLLTIRDNFKIKDESGHYAFLVKSKLLSIGDHLILDDVRGNRTLKIREEFFHLSPSYQIVSVSNGDADTLLASIKKKFTIFRKKFSIKSVYGNYDLEALNVFGRSFTLMKDGVTSAIVTKKTFSVADTYDVEIFNGEQDHAFVLALVIILHQILFDTLI